MSTSEHKQEMTESVEESTGQSSRAGRKRRRLAMVAVLVFVALLVAVSFRLMAARSETPTYDSLPTAEVRRGNLTVKVTEGGTLRALESLEVKSEVEGNNQILEIVPEGTIITNQDVADGKILVRLDSSGLEEQADSREISFRNAEASYVQAKENHDIQRKQNESNINAAELKVKFARMELDRYLGSELASALLAGEIAYEAMPALAREVVEQILGNPELSEQIFREMPRMAQAPEGLPPGGVVRQTLRELSADVQLARQELEQAEDDLGWTRKLEAKGYVSSNRLEADELTAERGAVRLASAEEELRLFIRYTVAKEAEQRRSDFTEAQLELERVKARARSELAQAEANLASREANYKLEKERLEKTHEMIEKCTIRATKPGVVVYASTSDPWRRRDDPIQEGSNVRQNETIITVPDLSTLAARVNVHETEISKVKPGQEAWISVEAKPGSRFRGEVVKVSPMASSEHRWLNPDVMVYETDVVLNGQQTGLTPGMSATAEVIVAELEDTLYVPLQAVTTYRRQRACWVKTDGEPQLRPVEVGHLTERYAEIRDGLVQGEKVFLAPPREMEETTEQQAADEEAAEEAEREGAEQAAPSPAPQMGGGTPAAPSEGEQQQPPPQESDAESGEVDMDALVEKIKNLEPSQMREFFQNLSDAERQAMRNLTDEQRQELFGRFGRGGGGRPGGGEGGENWRQRRGSGQQSGPPSGNQQ
ncbi:MAG: efflux RND transporter periplasmic adaptor subunit [Candidatus Brocadiia bacterium]